MKFFTIAVFFFITVTTNGQLIPQGSDWHYYDLGQAPPNQSGVSWKQPAYDHSAWNTGPSELGYGDNDELTVISSATFTGYFRQAFNVNDTSDYSGLTLHLRYDDGAVVYLNGTEIWRVNMPPGTITYNTFAANNSGDNVDTTINISNTLVNGSNLLAVEVHQRSASSTDLSFDFSMSGIPANGTAVITRGPYLQSASDTSVIVRWRTNIPTESIVDFGAATNMLTSTKSDLALKTEHILSINSLNGNTQYFYQIRNTNDTLIFPSTDLYFKTYPVAGQPTSLTAWILGDCGTANNNQRSVRNAFYNYIGAQHTDMMLFLGDNAYNDGTDAEYQFALFENMYEDKLKNTIAWSCLGNHDGHTANSNLQTGPYYDIFSFPTDGECGGVPSGTEAYYSYDFGNIHFVILDSYETSRSVTGPMHQWCEGDLESTIADWIIAIWHHPAYSKGSHNSDTETELKQMRENFLPLFEEYGVDLVLSGHSHSHERSFLLNGHYGLTSSFNIINHTVGINGDESGNMTEGVPYYKAPVGPEGGDGAVYITTGSAGKTSNGPMDHPAMFYDAITLGSCVLKINQDTLSVIYLRPSGDIDDAFTLIKDLDCNPGNACNDNDPCTINDVLDNNCLCRGTPDLRSVTSIADSGAGTLRDAITHACEGDTIIFDSSLNDTINLFSEMIIDKDLSIIAYVEDEIVISGQHLTRIFQIESGREVVLSGMTLHGGYHLTQGGALLNDGLLILDSTNFVNNLQGAEQKAWTNTGEIRVREGSTLLKID